MLRLTIRLRERKLAGSESVGRHARNLAWLRFLAQLRENWLLFLGVAALPTIFAIYALAMLHGAVRWAVVGAAVISGPWLVTIMALLLSGAAPTMMGVQAEEWTAQEFRILRRRGWKLINGFHLHDRADIDHLAIGPSGIFVVETKWSGDVWPIAGGNQYFMRQRLDKTTKQVRRNLWEVRKFLETLPFETPCKAVCVLWSAVPESEGEKRWESDDVVIISGRDLRSWLRDLEDFKLDGESVRLIWEKFVEFELPQSDAGTSSKQKDRPTLRRIVFGWSLSAISGVIGALSIAILFARVFNSWPIESFAILALLLFGLLSLRLRRLKPLAAGFLIGRILSAVVLLIAVVKVH